jgi:alkylation response protein AidB-like acyl-CoA dehydrogenase
MNISTTTFQALEELLPRVRERRGEIETQRKLPRDLVDDLRRTGLFRMAVPRAIRGAEATPMTLMTAAELIATADGSVGWCAMVGTSNNVVSGYMNEDGAREIFSDPTQPTAGIAAPIGRAVKENGGLRVTGRWPFGSGITHSPWLWAGTFLIDGDTPVMTPHGPEMLHVCIPVNEVTIHDTWHVSGMCGTGSNDFSVENVFVPHRRVFRLVDPAGHRKEPLYQMPPVGLFVYQVAAVALGIARGALDDVTGLVQHKKPAMYETVIGDRPATQIAIARAEAALSSARALLFGLVERMWEGVRAGRQPSLREQAIARAASTHAVETAAAVTRTASTHAGGTSLFMSSALQQRTRDAEALTHHFTVAPHTWEQVGRVLLARDPGVPAF